MKNSLRFLTVFLLAAAPASAATPPSATSGPVACSASSPSPSPSLRERIAIARVRHAARGVTDLQAEREQRRLASLRPLGPDCLGSLLRRKHLGDRTVTSADDPRLGATLRRQVLAGRTLHLTNRPTRRAP